jgi:hypothetical protein
MAKRATCARARALSGRWWRPSLKISKVIASFPDCICWTPHTEYLGEGRSNSVVSWKIDQPQRLILLNASKRLMLPQRAPLAESHGNVRISVEQFFIHAASAPNESRWATNGIVRVWQSVRLMYDSKMWSDGGEPSRFNSSPFNNHQQNPRQTPKMTSYRPFDNITGS